MSGTDSPVEGSGNDTALSVEAGAAAIENLLSSVPEEPETAPDSAPNEESNAGQKEASAESPEDDADGLEFDDEATGPEADAPDTAKDKAPKYASDETLVMFEGKPISVAELKANGMFQRKFTEKSMALSEEKKSFEQERSQFAETKNQIEHQRQVLLTLASQLLPKEPDPVDPQSDPMGYMLYLQEREAYQQKMQQLEYIWQSEQQGKVQLTEAQKKEQEDLRIQQMEAHELFIKEQEEQFLSQYPRLRDPVEYRKFALDTFQHGESFYNIPAEEIAKVPDSRYLRVLADAIAYRKAIAKRDAAKNPAPVQQAQQPRIQQRQRMAPQTPQSRDHNSAIERLRKTGSTDWAAKALEKFV